MASDFSLFTLSDLEKTHIKEAPSDFKRLDGFKGLESLIQHSLKAPNLLKTHTPEGNPLKNSTPIKRPFHDEAIVKKLLQYRDQIPLSARILRPSSEPESSS